MNCDGHSHAAHSIAPSFIGTRESKTQELGSMQVSSVTQQKAVQIVSTWQDRARKQPELGNDSRY